MSSPPDVPCWICVSDDTLRVEDAHDFLRTDTTGAVNVYVGTPPQRADTPAGDTKALDHVEYEAYTRMAEEVMARVGDEIRGQYDVERVVLWHRTGTVSVGSAGVLVGVAAEGREQAFAACRRLIDAMRQQVPVWKKHVYADGTSEWIRGVAPPSVAPARHSKAAS